MPLEIFKVSEEEAIHVSDTWLFDITKKIFEHVGVSSEDACLYGSISLCLK